MGKISLKEISIQRGDPARIATAGLDGTMTPQIMTRRKVLGFTVSGLAALATGSCLLACQRPAATKVTIADSKSVGSALFYVAKAKSYLADEGIELETVPANSGKEALDTVITGKADLCMVAEAPFVRAIAAASDVQILATVETSERNTSVIVPANSAIQAPEDLRNKRVGYCPGTASEYFLSVFLAANKIPPSDITAVKLAPKDAHEALKRGDVDAIAGWQEIRVRADKILGARTRAMYATGVYLESWNMVGAATWLSAHEAVAEGLLRALLKAQTYLSEHRSEAIDITSVAVDVDRATIDEMWSDYAFDISLDQALISNLEGHWRLINEAYPIITTPNFVDRLAVKALETVDESRVTYLR